MSWSTWLAVVTICLLGAMSPGPSLALVLKHTLGGGRRHGMAAALAHGLGVGIYALLSIVGLAAVIAASPPLFALLQWGGAGYLAWLGLKGLTARPRPGRDLPASPAPAGALRDGFLVVFLNPKIAIFFLALFSQVVGVDTAPAAKLGYALTALVIDALWYLAVAWLFSLPLWLARLQRQAIWLERIFGALLLALVARMVAGLLANL